APATSPPESTRNLTFASRLGGEEGLRECTIRVLEIYKKQCDRDGYFDEAWEASESLRKLKYEQTRVLREEVRRRHAEELRSLQKYIQQQRTEYYRQWEEERLPNLKRAVEDIRESLVRRQALARDELHRKLRKRRYRVAASGKVLDMLARARSLTLREDYGKARLLLGEVEKEDSRSRMEEQAHEEDRVCRLMRELADRQRKERTMVEGKIQDMRQEVLRQQQREFEDLERRAGRKLAALRTKQKKELSEMVRDGPSFEGGRADEATAAPASRTTCFSIIESLVGNKDPTMRAQAKAVSAAEELQDFRREREGQLIIREQAPLLVVSFGQKYSGPNSSKYKIEGKYHIPVNYKAILKWGDDEMVVLTRQGPFGPEFQIIYLPKSTVADDFTLFDWNSNMTQLWDELLTVLETMDEGGTRDMTVFTQGPWYVFGLTEDAVQLELDKVKKKDDTEDLVDGILYCEEPDKPTLEEYQRYLGVQPEVDDHFVWISHEFMNESLPANYYQYTNAGMVYWVNAVTQESTWKHPHYDKYKKMLSAARINRPLPHWKTIMSFQVEFLFSELFNLNDPSKTDFDVPIETVNNVFELARIFKVDIKEEPYLTHVLERALRHYADVVRSKRAVGGVEEFRNLMQRYRDVVQQFEKANELESEQVTSLRQCVECPDDNKEPAVLYCDNCKDMLCQPCFDRLHCKGQRQNHKRTWVELGICAECDSSLAQLHCVQCQDALCYSCYEQIHIRGGRRNHVPIVLRSFSLSMHTIPASSTFAFGAISPAAVTIGSNAARNLAISMSPWVVFEDECEVKV
ncbi:hypothetical protein FOZ62_023242, partial [Perkinsus olseni]